MVKCETQQNNPHYTECEDDDDTNSRTFDEQGESEKKEVTETLLL